VGWERFINKLNKSIRECFSAVVVIVVVVVVVIVVVVDIIVLPRILSRPKLHRLSEYDYDYDNDNDNDNDWVCA